ncbi:hypothetical protein D4764_13G0001440 [Takifugu flavidus]|uniref:Uncharacterized protein n=1 Tax=Takifugu flavidus TaxID=433684 RepID=A0A5C6P719_9TELE|nr:hypothetical protein D4764_13G0001440 [Takifugu flavidus]
MDQQPEDEQPDGGEGTFASTSVTSTSSNTELPPAAAVPRCHHGSRTFTGLRIFCRSHRLQGPAGVAEHVQACPAQMGIHSSLGPLV